MDESKEVENKANEIQGCMDFSKVPYDDLEVSNCLLEARRQVYLKSVAALLSHGKAMFEKGKFEAVKKLQALEENLANMTCSRDLHKRAEDKLAELHVELEARNKELEAEINQRPFGSKPIGGALPMESRKALSEELMVKAFDGVHIVIDGSYHLTRATIRQLYLAYHKAMEEKK